MSVRARLVLSVFLLQAVSVALLGWGVLLVKRQQHVRDVEASERALESMVRRLASEALLQDDDLQLISYLNFVRSQHPAIAHARVEWRRGSRTRAHALGGPPGPGLWERRLSVEDPGDGTRADILLALDRAVLERPFDESRRRLGRMIVAVWCGTSLLGLLISIALARSFARPLEALGRVAEEIGSGRLGARMEWDGDDEIGRFVRVFNMMSAHLEELDAAKRNFVSSVTHELRSPLGAIESFLQLIRDRMEAGPQGLAQSADYLERIAVNVRRLSSFINDLLDAAKIESGRMECVLRPMRLGPVAAEVCQFFEAKASQQKVELASRAAAAPPVLGDSERLRQVLVNLVSNGLKFTPAGGRVVIGAETVRSGGRRWVEVSVTDTGRGMDGTDRLRVFEPFTQGRNVSDGVSGQKGTGLGLYIVRSIVEQHGGKIDVQSAPGRGTKVRFSLRAA